MDILRLAFAVFVGLTLVALCWWLLRQVMKLVRFIIKWAFMIVLFPLTWTFHKLFK